MLVEMAIGDAYGAGFEYAPRDLVESRNDLSGYVRHPRHKITPGCYTDDTQMSLALAEAIVEGDDWTALALARRFVEVFRRDPRPGYAQGYSDFIRSVRDEHEFLDRIKPDSEKSGAAMRASPIGVLSDTSRVIERATSQASITHNTYTGIRSACAAALMR